MLLQLLAQANNEIPLGDKPITGAGYLGEQTALNLPDNVGLLALFTDQLSNIISLITLIGGIFFLVFFLIAGFEWLRAGGDTGKTESAKNRMTNAAIGLLIMILATSLVGIVGGVFGFDILNPGIIFQTIIPGGGTP